MARRAGVVAIGFGLILVCASVGIFYLAAAAYAWLAPLMGSAGAGFALGAVLLLPAIVFAVLYELARRQHAREEAERMLRNEPEAGSLAAFAIAALGAVLRARPLATAALATAIGALAARHPRVAVAVARRLIPRGD